MLYQRLDPQKLNCLRFFANLVNGFEAKPNLYWDAANSMNAKISKLGYNWSFVYLRISHMIVLIKRLLCSAFLCTLRRITIVNWDLFYIFEVLYIGFLTWFCWLKGYYVLHFCYYSFYIFVNSEKNYYCELKSSLMKWPGNTIENIIKALVNFFSARGRNSKDDRLKKGLEKSKDCLLGVVILWRLFSRCFQNRWVYFMLEEDHMDEHSPLKYRFGKKY